MEVGTWRGASAVRWLRQQPAWMGLVDPYRAKLDGSWEGRVSQPYIERIRRRAMRRVERHNRGALLEWLRMDSTQAAPQVADGSLDVVYIDGDHSFEAVQADVRAWWSKVKPGGFMVLDDHIGGRWWEWDVIMAAASFHPRNEKRRVERGRWLVIEKAAMVEIVEREAPLEVV